MDVRGDLARSAVGQYAGQLCRWMIRDDPFKTARVHIFEKIEPKIADIGAALGVDDHVVAMKLGDVVQVGMHVDFAVHRPAKHLTLLH